MTRIVQRLFGTATAVLISLAALPQDAFSADGVTAERKAQLQADLELYASAQATRTPAASYVIAQRIYEAAQKVHKGDPAEFGPLVFLYAKAAARVREPGAYDLFREAAKALEAAHGARAQALIPVLADWGYEAVSRNRTEGGYSILKRLGDLLEAYPETKGTLPQLIHSIGLAQLYHGSGELGPMRSHLDKAQLLFAALSESLPIGKRAALSYDLGFLEHKQQNWLAAKLNFTEALKAFQVFDPRDKRILRSNLRLARINHALGMGETVCENLSAAYRFRDWSLGRPAYDPDVRYSTASFNNQGAVAKITFRLEVQPDCRARVIEVSEALGMTAKEAAAWLESVYVFEPEILEASGRDWPLTVEDTWILYPGHDFHS